MQMMIADSEDLLIEILLWLPAKALIRFKSVCKRWSDLISSHRFSEQHTLQQRHRFFRSKSNHPSLLLHLADASTYLYLQCSSYGEKLVPYAFPSALAEPTIRSFSNGLFLLQCRSVENPFEVCRVYNPTTKLSKKILFNVNEMYPCVMGLNLVFDPSRSSHYKIVCVKAARRRSSSFMRSWWRRCQIEIYESDTNTWTLCGEPFLAPRVLNFDEGIEWKGCIHWCGVFFDLRECVVGKHPEIEVGETSGIEGYYQKMVESNGFLHNIAHFPKKRSFMVFELQSDFTEWSLKYHVNLDAEAGTFSMLSYVRGEGEEDSKLLLHEAGKIKHYALQENCMKEVVDFRGKEFYKGGDAQSTYKRAFEVIETLASV